MTKLFFVSSPGYTMSKLNKLVPTVLTLLIGAGCGALGVRGMQMTLNKAERAECERVQYRKLVHLTTVVGDTYHCLPSYYFRNQ
jgi:hypothetical protein